MIQQIGELEEALYVALESTPRISLLGALKNIQKCEEKDAFYAAVDNAIKGCNWGYIWWCT